MNDDKTPNVNVGTPGHCDHGSSKSAVERVVMRQRAYIEAIKPYTDARAEIYRFTLPTITIYPDGRAEHHYNFTPEQEKALEQIDEVIKSIKAQFTDA